MSDRQYLPWLIYCQAHDRKVTHYFDGNRGLFVAGCGCRYHREKYDGQSNPYIPEQEAPNAQRPR